MKQALVILIGDQTIPNLLFLKRCVQPDKDFALFFISTEAMEKKGKSSHIAQALKMSAGRLSPRIITVPEDSLAESMQELTHQINCADYDHIRVNCTGGTKLMSLASYLFFNKVPHAEIFYEPASGPIRRIWPEADGVCDMPAVRLSLDEYFSAWNVKAKRGGEPAPEGFESLYKKIQNKRDAIKKLTILQNDSYFKNKIRRNPIDMTQIAEERFTDAGFTKEAFIQLARDFGYDPKKWKRSHMRRLTGGWFEAAVYHRLRNELELSDPVIASNYIACNVKISLCESKHPSADQKSADAADQGCTTGSLAAGNNEEEHRVDNELDVVYIDANNRLHIVECKSFLDSDDESKGLINDTIYKLQALRNNFGLTAQLHLYTCSPITSGKKRAKVFDIDICDNFFGDA